jgi:mono/diheme cytochrome c family protein
MFYNRHNGIVRMKRYFTSDTGQMRKGLLWVKSVVHLSLLLVLLALIAGCSTAGLSQGSYPVDFFTEMHYNQSFKLQEPPSLSAVSEAVPTTGREVNFTLAQARELENPFETTQATINQGSQLFEINCSVCHGTSGQGDGPMKDHLATAGYRSAPADLTSSGPSAAKSEGEIYLVITNGFAKAYGLPVNQFVMPPFQKLLAPEDRWAIVSYIRNLQDR